MRKLLAPSLATLLFVVSSCSRSGPEPLAPPPATCGVDQATENPLHDHGRVTAMQVLTKKAKRGNVLGDKREGVALALSPERGLTREWLSHVLACDARSPHPESTSCPLSLPGARPSVGSLEGQLVVYVHYSDPLVAARAAELAERFRPE